MFWIIFILILLVMALLFSAVVLLAKAAESLIRRARHDGSRRSPSYRAGHAAKRFKHGQN